MDDIRGFGSDDGGGCGWDGNGAMGRLNDVVDTLSRNLRKVL